ncbi:MAG: TolC family protein, partial [Gammaproteobacteria bacterium]|nr:TolC family protein [Gammaproteobacteria bacterium]MBU1833643.1 TolC family protein [Gammaproteobacteria bacterium]
MNKLSSSLNQSLIAITLLSGLSACANYGGINSSKTMLDAKNLGTEQSLGTEQDLTPVLNEWPSQAWWTSFNDPQLDSLIAEAQQNSPSLAIAAAKLARANASLENVQGASLPTVGLSADATRQHYTENG